MALPLIGPAAIWAKQSAQPLKNPSFHFALPMLHLSCFFFSVAVAAGDSDVFLSDPAGRGQGKVKKKKKMSQS